jgi:hypothetical protein
MQALGSVRLDRAEMASRHLTGAICCGAMFLCVKIFEYWDKFSHDLFPTTNDFFTFYFVLTMIHLVHLIVGTVALANLRRGGDRGHLPSRTYAGSRVRGDLLASCGSLVDLSFRASLSFAVSTMTLSRSVTLHRALLVLLAATAISFLVSPASAIGALAGWARWFWLSSRGG